MGLNADMLIVYDCTLLIVEFVKGMWQACAYANSSVWVVDVRVLTCTRHTNAHIATTQIHTRAYIHSC